MKQNSIFLNCEGDAWYDRNQNHLMQINITGEPDVSYILSSMLPVKNQIDNILEIGCSSGIKLKKLCDELDAKGVGIEPSEKAVMYGNAMKHDAVTLVQGTGDSLPFADASFDLVNFAFCLYLFDRNTLLKSLAEADRVLKPGGYMVITDFDPGTQRKRPYSHFPGLFSYKQNYASLYTSAGLYYLTGKKSFSHRSPVFEADADERVSTQILYKEKDAYINES
jgi:ubiquinone/menaquinone biosynthesis C-methylase UbiE